MLCMGWARSARPPFTAGTAGFARRGGGAGGAPWGPDGRPSPSPSRGAHPDRLSLTLRFPRQSGLQCPSRECLVHIAIIAR